MRTVTGVPIDRIIVDPEYANLYAPLPRAVYADLLESIRRVGILIAPIVKAAPDGLYVMLSGHHRLKAALECGMTELKEVRIAETPEETVDTLLDNATRRQMTERDRRASMAQDQSLMETSLQKGLLPEYWERYGKDKRERDTAFLLATLGLEVQRKLLEEEAARAERAASEHTVSGAAGDNRFGMEAERKLALAETEKQTLTKTLEDRTAQLEAKQREVEDLNDRIQEIQADVTRKVFSVADDRDPAESSRRGETENEVHELIVKQKEQTLTVPEASHIRRRAAFSCACEEVIRW